MITNPWCHAITYIKALQRAVTLPLVLAAAKGLQLPNIGVNSGSIESI